MLNQQTNLEEKNKQEDIQNKPKKKVQFGEVTIIPIEKNEKKVENNPDSFIVRQYKKLTNSLASDSFFVRHSKKIIYVSLALVAISVIALAVATGLIAALIAAAVYAVVASVGGFIYEMVKGKKAKKEVVKKEGSTSIVNETIGVKKAPEVVKKADAVVKADAKATDKVGEAVVAKDSKVEDLVVLKNDAPKLRN